MFRQESKVFNCHADAIRYAKDILGNPTIVVLPFQFSQAMIVPSVDEMQLPNGVQMTLSEAIKVNGERCSLCSLGENLSGIPPTRQVAVHTVSQGRIPQIIEAGLMLAMGRYGLHDGTAGYYIEEDSSNLAISISEAQFETDLNGRELSPAFGQPCHRLPVTNDQMGKLEDVMGDRHIPLNFGEKQYREALREQVLALFNLAGLLIRIPPQKIDIEVSLAANSGQKRSALEKLFMASNL